MYYITGTVTKIKGEFALVDANGIGYQIHMTQRLAEKISLGKDKILVIQLSVHGQESVMFGFATPKERCLFALLVRENMLPVLKAFRIVSKASDELVGMLSEFKVDELKDVGLSEDEVITLCSRIMYGKFDIAQDELDEEPIPRKIIPIKEEPKQPMSPKEALLDADGNSLVEQAIQAVCILRDLKPQQAESFVQTAIQKLGANSETPVQDIIIRANEMARNS